MAERAWTGTTYGNSLMHRWLTGLLRVLDVRLIYAFARVFVVPPSMLFHPGYGFIYRYFRERWGYGPLKACWKTYQNHCVFAEAVIDKFAMYAGRRFDIRIEGYEHYQQLAQRPEGFVMLSSHVGNYEIAGYSLTAVDKPLNALVYSGEKESVMRSRNRMFSHTNIRMIPIREDMSHVFEMNSALTRGEIVSIPADRIWGSSKCLKIPFLGREARFPLGPFSVATARGLSVLAVHVMKTSTRGYTVCVTPLSYDREAPRSQQIEQLSGQYVAELERIVRMYPTQWYNYFDFWQLWKN